MLTAAPSSATSPPSTEAIRGSIRSNAQALAAGERAAAPSAIAHRVGPAGPDHSRASRLRVLVQGWSEANSEQPRKGPLGPLRMVMTPTPQDSQAGGLASQETFVQREEAPAMTAKPVRQPWQRGAR